MSDVQYVLYGSDGLGVSVDAWRNDFKEYIEEMELDIEPENEIEFYQYIFETSFDDTKDWREFREIEFANNTFMITDVEHGNMCEKHTKSLPITKYILSLNRIQSKCGIWINKAICAVMQPIATTEVRSISYVERIKLE